jgi:hypothetical protein
MLPHDVSRCAGFLGDGPERCTRRFTCARFLESPGLHTPFAWSVCGGGVDAYIHAESIVADADKAHPAHPSSIGVLDATALRTGGAVGDTQ